jgi:hypothetical protein
MDQLHLTNQQCKTLYSALRHYESYLNQPNEMAEDNTQKRQDTQELIKYFDKHPTLNTRYYKLVDKTWVLQP